MIILISVTFVLLALVHQFWWRRHAYPNGPLPLPIIGNIHQFAFYKRWEDKFVEFKEQYGSVYTLFLGPIPVITVNDYDTCVRLFAKEGHIYSNRPTLEHFNRITRGGTYGLGQTNGQQWLEQRRVVLRILKDFGLGKNQMQERILDEFHTICDNLNNEIKKGVVEHNINQHTDIAIGSVINSLLCGYRFTTNNKASEFEHLKYWSDRFTRLITDPIASLGIYSEHLSRWPFIRQKMTDLREVFDELFSFVDRIIEEHKAHNDYEHMEEFHPNDLIDAYMQEMWKVKRTGIGEYYSEVQCRNIVLDLWLAGQETTSTTTQWFFAFVILNQDKQAKIHDELNRVIGSDRTILMSDRSNLPYLNAVINEAQRCAALPVLNVPHALAKDTTLNGFHLKKETIIFPQISAIMKDPANFPNPNVFYPERFINSNGQLFNTEKVVSFSIGKRSCPGEGLARMELFLLTANLLNQYKFFPTKEPPSLDRCVSGGLATCKQFNLKLFDLFLLGCVVFHKTGAELKKAEDVFEPGFDFLQKNLELCLDDFARKDAVIEVLELKDLSLCISAPSRFPKHWLNWYYKKSVENLQKAAPNLKNLELNGGYVYNPKNFNNIDELKSEISYLHTYLNAIALAIERSQFRLKVNIFNVFFVFSEHVKSASDYKQLLFNKFGQSSILDETDSSGVEMLIEAGKNTEIHLNLAFLTNLELIEKVRLPKGRTQFRHAAEKYLKPLWKQMAEESKLKALEPFKSLVPPGIRWISNPRQLRLEEFYQEGFLQEQKELEQITVGFSTPPDYLDISVQDYYKQSVENLRATFANLKRVRFEGGYVYKPEDELSPETFRVLTDEIVYLQNLTGALIKAVKTTNDDRQKLELLQLDLRTVWFYTTNKDFNLKRDVDKLKDKLRDALHPDLIIEDPIKTGELYIESKIGETKCRIFLNLIENLPELSRTLSAGRFPYTSII